MTSATTKIDIHLTQKRQKIDGYGASNAWMSYQIRQCGSSLMTLLFDPVNGVGLTILRMRIPTDTINPSSTTWNWSGDNDNVAVIQQAMALAGSDLKILATPWTPPAWMKTNNNVNNGGALSTAHYGDYAQFFVTFIQQYATRF